LANTLKRRLCKRQ